MRVVHVVAAALIDAAGRVLVARRPEDVHQGGLWEFPGGKVEPGERAEEALARELDEELGVRPRAARPLIRVHHAYPDKSVRLDVWRVTRWDGEAHGREGQPLAWWAPADCDPARFPAADGPIITALRLPATYLITPEPGADRAAFLDAVEAALQRGVRLLQLRAKTLAPAALGELYGRVQALARRFEAHVLLNAEPALAAAIGADGVHLSAAALRALDRRPPVRHWVAASCHDADELAHAARIGVDFAVLGPVAATATHPGAPALGWQRFAALAEAAALPVFALGGLAPADLGTAWRHGAQGVAAIRGLWNAPNARA